MAQSIYADESAAAAVLAGVRIQLLWTVKDKARARRYLARHPYRGDVRAVGEQLFYAVLPARSHWRGVLVFCAASRRLRAPDRWIGWSEEQRRRRLPRVVNNCRFLILPDKTFPNLGSRSLRLTLDRLSAHWQERYGQFGRHRAAGPPVRRSPGHSPATPGLSGPQPTDFFTAMNAEHHRYAIRCLHARQPCFKTSS